MNEQVFFEKHEADWRRLAELCDRADHSPTHLTAAELREFVALYRRISRDLTLARTRSDNAPLIDHLNDVAGRAYGVLYRQPRRPLGQVILNAITEIACAFRRRVVFFWISFAITLASLFGAVALLGARPDMRSFVVPPGMQDSFDHWREGTANERTGSESALMTGFYLSNNPRVAVIAGAVGAGTFGFGSLYLIVGNGAMLGALSREVAPVGRLPYLYGSILPHGVPEMTGAILSGAVGLMLGWALIHPGRRSRGDALRAAGKDAITLLGASVLLMFIAAPIEGFFSFNPRVPLAVKWTVGLIELGFWIAFWSQWGKGEGLDKRSEERA